MGVPLLPIWLLLTGLLGPIGESTCLITYEDTFKFAKNDASALLSKRKGMGHEFFGAPQPLSKLEYAQKITWKHPGTYESKGEVSHMRTEADHAAQILEYLEEHVFPRLYLLMYRKLGKPFAEGTEEKYLKKMQALLGYSRKLLSEMDETIMEPEGLDRIPRSKAASKASFSKLFEYFHDICGMIFGWSDALAEYLSILQTHPLVNVQDLTESLNEGDHWIVLFHCVLGRSPPEDKATSVFLTYDFKKSLQQSGRIEDIHSLLDLMKEENWRKMENLYLLMRSPGLKRTHPMFFKPASMKMFLRDTEMWKESKRFLRHSSQQG
ncbi:hypothetical protein Pst134EA_031986 [Puccinia striiformis f. sp. tritici]|uniref:uncharacterized protein n=1 Tax=Puccinia striiformis f. sp. tritici TaxID=168172 RepID=UPI002008502D|nr:uncharacterized protein Pst134EA_031986 [Puccinia striiformis f. sp. tritici]KAH9441942.1 hypothetical protein Pst134EA_031986 [Puccinia striiformis f. sp. tritici]